MHSLPLPVSEVSSRCAGSDLEFQRERFLGKGVERRVKDKAIREEKYSDSLGLLRSTVTTAFTSGTCVGGNNVRSQKPRDRNAGWLLT